ncbi:epidermal growth factor receptor-like [Anomaloglossus baeobatrachus]|uniref:epidermal growth factor receptor-like n=1 Tax=Anomaloglossus baeobatrachus TaxID=238106 RepID=UPI003F4F6B30
MTTEQNGSNYPLIISNSGHTTNVALKSDWTKYGYTSINNVLKENTYILKPRKEIYNITSEVDRPKVDVLNAIHVLNTIDKKVCSGSANRLSQMGDVEDHYKFLKKIYQGCQIVLGNLEITHIKANADISFFKDIQEVEGYVLIATNEVKSIPLENLRLIRGETLYNYTALSIFSNYKPNSTDGLKELPMRQLQEIIHGGVNIKNNPRLCNLHTINWKDIVHSNYSVSVRYMPFGNCSECDIACNGSCWSHGPENCQIFTKLTCDQTCPGRCRGPKPSDCCDCKCAAGCNGPKETDCLVKTTCNEEVRNRKICYGIGHGKLKEALAVNASNIDDFENCTIVLGNVILSIFTLRYRRPLLIVVAGIGVKSLLQRSPYCPFVYCDNYTKTPVIDQAKLNILKSIREITGHLVVTWLPEMYNDLSIFENLEVIRGRPKFNWKYALVVSNVSISSLGLKSLKEVSDGDVIIRRSKNLCYSDTINWTKISRTKQQKIKISNKSPEECVAEGKICDPLCSEDGCWGPGPSQCFSCRGKECA